MKRFDAGFSWLNPPASYEDGGRQATVTTRDKTDFWRNTFYGFRHDNGHFLFKPVSGDFSAEVTIRGKYSALYDQAGLMLRIDEERWVKAGIEFTDGETHFSVVVTDGHSDWSVVPMAWAVQSVTLRVTQACRGHSHSVQGSGGPVADGAAGAFSFGRYCQCRDHVLLARARRIRGHFR